MIVKIIRIIVLGVCIVLLVYVIRGFIADVKKRLRDIVFKKKKGGENE